MKDLIDHIKDNCTPIDREARFDQMLDDLYDFSRVGGPFNHMVPSQVLKEMDPTAYRCGVNDYMDGEDTYEIDGETYDMAMVEEARDEFVSELATDLEAIEEMINELDTQSEDFTEEDREDYGEHLSNRDKLTLQIEQAEKYQF